MRIGLTGASGVLGRHLDSKLRAFGHNVVPFSGDVRDVTAIKPWVDRVERVVHAAALVPVQQVSANVGAAVAVNSGGTANLAAAVRDQGKSPLVYISTSHVYAGKSTPLSEGDITRPVSLYGLTKLHGEEWVGRLVPESLIVRVFSFFDVHQREPYLIPALRRRILEAPIGADLELMGAVSTRDIADADWMGHICAQLIHEGHTGIVNCGTGAGRTVLAIAQELAEIMGRTDLHWNASPVGTPDHVVADISKLRQVIGTWPSFELGTALAYYVSQCGG